MEQTKKLNICLVFGGKSGEHEVSLQSARSVYEALDKEKYTIFLVGVDKNGVWRTCKYEDDFIITTLLPEIKSNFMVQNNIDVVLPIMHGTYGEDGVVQGYLEHLQVAYVGAGVLGSAVGMDKDVMKRLLRDAGLPIGKFITLRDVEDAQLDDALDKIIEDAICNLDFPIFVKPANMGSSVGISKATTKQELRESIKTARLYDTKIILEEYIPGNELEASVLGGNNPEVSVIGEIRANHDFYSYEAKYLDKDGARTRIPAAINPEITKRVQELARQAFVTLECYGMGRVDFFLTTDNQIYINEINTIPGFTSISMYPKLWEASGISYPDLLDKLITLARIRKAQKDRLKTNLVLGNPK